MTEQNHMNLPAQLKIIKFFVTVLVAEIEPIEKSDANSHIDARI